MQKEARMWRGRVHGAWFVAAVAIAVAGVVALSARSNGPESTDATSWAIMVATVAGAGYCLFRASRRKQGPPRER